MGHAASGVPELVVIMHNQKGAEILPDSYLLCSDPLVRSLPNTHAVTLPS